MIRLVDKLGNRIHKTDNCLWFNEAGTQAWSNMGRGYRYVQKLHSPVGLYYVKSKLQYGIPLLVLKNLNKLEIRTIVVNSGNLGGEKLIGNLDALKFRKLYKNKKRKVMVTKHCGKIVLLKRKDIE